MKKLRHIFCLILLFCFQLSFSQTAPDFTINGTDGQVHELYADYLDQGKTVVIDIMFTICPPCNAFAPYIEPLYQTWGGGDGDVEFFTFSNQGFDSNDDVLGWKIGHGITSPGAGEDGGALEVVAPYVNGDFGFFVGTPTFVVIAPDGTVNFNVGFGTSGQSKADAIHAAIEATGATPPIVTKTIEGIIRTPDADPVSLVEMSVSPGHESLHTTDESGLFNIDVPLDVNLTYTLSALKDINPLNGVSTFDMIFIAKHILNVEVFTDPYKLIAADINNSGSITTVDLVELRKVILFIEPTFPNNTSWRFQLSDCNFETCGLDDLVEFTTEDDLTDLEVIGIKIGDVNYTADPTNLASLDDRGDKPSIQFDLPNLSLKKGETIQVPIQSKQLESMMGAQFTLEFEEEYLQFSHFEKSTLAVESSNFNFNKSEEGAILFSWNDLHGVDLMNAPLFYLNFKVLQEAPLEDLIRFSSKYTPVEIFDSNFQFFSPHFEADKVFSDLKVSPNPFNDQFCLDLDLKEDATIRLHIFNAQGKMINTKSFPNLPSGNQKLFIESGELLDGVYFLEIRHNSKLMETIRLIKN